MSAGLRIRDAALMAGAYGAVSYGVLQAVAFGYPTGAVFWPGAGLTLGVLARLPRERWPAVLAGVFVAEIVVDLTIPVSFGVALVWAVANTVEPLVGASLLRRGGRDAGLTTVAAVLRFLWWAVIVGPLVGATVGATIAAAAGVQSFWPTWPRWWIGDAIGVLVVAPALMARHRPDLAHAARLERSVLLVALAGVSVLAVFPWQAEGWGQALPYLLAPALVLTAMRLGPRPAALALAASATTINAITAMGIGPFGAPGTYGGLVVAQVCLAGGAVALLTVSALNHNLVTVQRVQEILRVQAVHDELTGLANRRLLAERLAASLAGLRRGHTHLALLLVDLDGFKQLNDTHGHLAGDAALVEVADRLRAAVRPTDTVARTGGDEFVVLLPGLADAALGETFRDRVAVALNRPMPWDGGELPLAASVGLATTADPDTSVDEILAAADHSMYAAKVARSSRAPVAQPDGESVAR